MSSRRQQPPRALAPAAEAALRSSIARDGVLFPPTEDQDGRLLEGRHRSRIATELGIQYQTDVREVGRGEDLFEVTRMLNARRRLRSAQRLPIILALYREGHTKMAIGRAVGISTYVVGNDLRMIGADDGDRTGGYRKNREVRFDLTNDRAVLVARANKARLIDGLSQINGLLRGLLELDYGIVAAALDDGEAQVWAKKAAEHSRSLKTLERKIKEAAANGT